MKYPLLAMVCLSTIDIAYGQATDNKGKDLFVVKTTSGYSFPVTSTGLSISFVSSFKDADTVEVTKAKYIRVNRRLKPSQDKTTFTIGSGDTTHYYVVIRHPHTNLQSYYSPDSLQVAVSRLSDTRLAVLNNIIPALDSINFHDTAQAHRIVPYLDSSRMLSVNGPYSVTDIGNGLAPYFINFKVTNLATSSLGSFFSESNQPVITAEFGFIQNSVLKFNNWDRLKNVSGLLGIKDYDFFYSIYANANCISYVDTINVHRTPYDLHSLGKFMQYGAKFNFTAYMSKTFAVALTANSWFGLPLDNDKNYQNTSSTPVSLSDTLYKKLGMSAGKYGGDLNKKLLNFRASVAVPIFFDLSSFLSLFSGNKQPPGSQFYFLPSYAPFISTHSTWTNQVGLSLNLLTQPYGPKNSTIVQAGGIGVDFISNPLAKTGWGSGLFYISGTVNVGALITRAGAPAVKQ